MRIPQIPEQFVRDVWQRQLFPANLLVTSEGAPVEVIFPGVINTDGGPDFVDAQLRIGRVLLCGDVEIHVKSAAWRRHGHDLDPHYNRVILHVALTADESAAALTASHRLVPLVTLEGILPPQAIEIWRKDRAARSSGTAIDIPCLHRVSPTPSPDNREREGKVTPELLRAWLSRLGAIRLQRRVDLMEERLHQLIDEHQKISYEPWRQYRGNPDDIPSPQRRYSPGDYAHIAPWEQLLYESICEGFGYAKNPKTFRDLARSLRLEQLRRFDLNDTVTMQALLFGTAGLLPSSRSLPEIDSRRYVRLLRRRWRELRPFLHIPMLHSGDWLFFRLRPANFPTARIASLAFLLPSLFGDGSFRRLISAFSAVPGEQMGRTISSGFVFTPDRYWSCHYDFRGIGGKHGIALGRARIGDLVVNSLIPIALLYARTFGDHRVQEGATSLLACLPPLQENAVSRAIRREFLAGTALSLPVLEQQGMLALYGMYCRKNLCEECLLGGTS